LIEKTDGFDFVNNDGEQVLKLESDDGAALAALNELLKQPLFEIRELSLEQIIEIEEVLAKNVDW